MINTDLLQTMSRIIEKEDKYSGEGIMSQLGFGTKNHGPQNFTIYAIIDHNRT